MRPNSCTERPQCSSTQIVVPAPQQQLYLWRDGRPFEVALSQFAQQVVQDKHRAVVWTLLDKEYLFLAQRWVARTRSFTSLPILWVALDSEVEHYCRTASVMHNKGIWCVAMDTETDFPKIGWAKFRVTQYLLRYGLDVFFSEFDVVWFRDFVDYIYNDESRPPAWQYQETWPKHLCEDCPRSLYPPINESDMAISGHVMSPRVNIGLYFVRATDNSRVFFDAVVYTFVALQNQPWDQVHWDALMSHFDVHDVQGRSRLGMGRYIKWHKLDTTLFASDYFDYDPSQLYTFHTTYDKDRPRETKPARLIDLYDNGPRGQ